MTKMAMHTMIEIMPMRAPNLSKFFCNGVWFAVVSGKHPHFLGCSCVESPAISAAMRPMRVDMPTSTTIPFALPLVTQEPEKTMFSGVSFSGPSPCFIFTFVFFATSSGSPVRAISLTLRSSESDKRRSAGTTSPVPRTTRSPRTTLRVSTLTSTPLRITEIAGCDILDKASRASPALNSVHAAIPALMMTMMKIACAVMYERKSRAFGPMAFTATEATAASIRRMMTKLVSCKRNNMPKVGFGGLSNSFGPSLAKASATLTSDMPLVAFVA
mmetsp:Transcript_72586/g.210077  ORF Transcript_72586/g.210077 Transcript_72586/m.210077 type:complete len:272 (-) Transcript_72586:152-967(-)